MTRQDLMGSGTAEAIRWAFGKDGKPPLHRFTYQRHLWCLAKPQRVRLRTLPVDAIWGIGLAADHAHAVQPDHWPGLNLLGFALMEVRDRFVHA